MVTTPAAHRTLAILRFLATQPQPVAAGRIADEVGLPRASTYRLLTAMADEGFVVHLPDERTFGLGVAAFEVGTGYVRQAPLQRLARVPLARLVDRLGESAHLAVLHGVDVLYVLEERAPGRPPLVTDVGVRLPAPVTASGRAMLALLPAAQVRALFPDAAALVHRHGQGPVTPSALRALLRETRRRGHAVERGEVTPGLASVAVGVVDHNGHPVAAVAVTYADDGPGLGGDADVDVLTDAVRQAADEIATRLGGGRPRR
jgi:DNA-binding IclR family transcriptional regulator